MTGTGSAITSTPLSEQTPPTILPAIVSGTMSPYLCGGFFDWCRGERIRSETGGLDSDALFFLFFFAGRHLRNNAGIETHVTDTSANCMDAGVFFLAGR